jgi:hypothetical protein
VPQVIPPQVAAEVGRVVDAAFERDWEFHRRAENEPRDGPPIVVRRKKGATEQLHSIWALYRWLKHSFMKDKEIKKFRFPMRGDGMPSIAGAPRRWEWISTTIRVLDADLEFLTGGPLFDASGQVLVPPTDPGDRWGRSPEDLEAEIRECEEAWEFVPRSPRGPHLVRLKAPTRKSFRVEALYWAAARFSSSQRGAPYAVPMDRDRAPLMVPPRRYFVSRAWRIAEEDVQRLTHGPLFSGAGHQLVMVADDAVTRLNMEEIDSFSGAAPLNDAGVAALLQNGWLKSVPEEEVKSSIHAIVGDTFVRSDWGGERSDVYTANVYVGGRRLHTAMALKGPSGGRRVSIASYGKNGDQIVRLFEEPAELFIVQSNGVFDSTLIKHVEQTARAARRPVHYCLMDARDTARLLVGYADVVPDEKG